MGQKPRERNAELWAKSLQEAIRNYGLKSLEKAMQTYGLKAFRKQTGIIG
jgi:hypothetical protein